MLLNDKDGWLSGKNMDPMPIAAGPPVDVLFSNRIFSVSLNEILPSLVKIPHGEISITHEI